MGEPLEVERPPQMPHLVAATSGIRLTNYLIDLVCFYVIIFAIGMVIALLQMEWIIDSLYFDLITILVLFGYYVFFEAIFSKTPGKALTRTTVTLKDGSKPGFAKILGRALCRFIPFEAFLFLRTARGWHDSFSDTWVIKDPKTGPLS